MKTVYVATFSQGNYGSALQAISLQCALKELGSEPVLIVAKSADCGNITRFFKTLKAYFWPEKHYGFIRKVRKFLERYEYEEKRKNIIMFCKKNAEYYEIDINSYIPLVKSSECIFLAGSDQVWNIIDREIQPLFNFEFIKDEDYLCYSYAASIGLDKLSDEQIRYYERALRRFKVISVREKSAVDLFQRSALKSKIRQDLDPTLLHDSSFWDGFASKREIDDDYIFVYMLRPDKCLITMAVELSKNENLKIVFCGLYSFRNKYMYTDTTAGPERFISYIKNAKYVITNSFHGTCFSIIYHKRFISVAIDSTGSRAAGLLEMLDLDSHFIYEAKNIDIIHEEINYASVDNKLENLREESYSYLKDITE